MSEKKFFIAGVQHHQIHEVLAELTEDEILDLVPEPTNSYDPNAVRIEFNGVMLGYVPKKFSAEISAMLETSELLCTITTLNKAAKPWEMCEVEIVPIIEEDLEDGLSDEEDNEDEDEEDL
jgi:hypothetical protein